MNALSPNPVVPEATPADRLVELAHAIIAGDHGAAIAIDDRYGHDGQPLYDYTDWRDAAEYAVDGDVSDLAHMLERNVAHDEFVRWQGGDYERRQFADFDQWLADRQAWNRRAA